MDINDKIREMKTEISQVSNEEQIIKARINDLKTLIDEKKRRYESLAVLKATEEQLLKELGL